MYRRNLSQILRKLTKMLSLLFINNKIITLNATDPAERFERT